MTRLEVSKDDCILVVAPHPDDECIGVGGLLTLFHNQCDVWLLSDGCQGRGDKSPFEIRKKRMQEFADEMQYLQPHNFRMFGLEDGTLRNSQDALLDIDMSCYTKIFVTGIDDVHMDHIAAYYMIQRAVCKQQLQNVKVYQYEISEPLHNVTHVLDITEVMEEKKQLISFHKTQLDIYDYHRMAESINAYRASIYRLRNSYIEAFAEAPVLDEQGLEEQKLFAVQKRLQRQIQEQKIYDLWLELELSGTTIADYLLKRGYKRIGIYGYSNFAKRLLQELKRNLGLTIACVIDQHGAQKSESGVMVITPEQYNGNADVIVVAVPYYFDEVQTCLNRLGIYNIISLEKLLFIIKENL